MLDYLVEEEWIAEPETVSTDELRGQQLLELKRLEFQERERERESQLKLKELELKERALNSTETVRVRVSSRTHSAYPVNRYFNRVRC